MTQLNQIERKTLVASDEVLTHVVNLRVLGMMCQRNCGTTVRGALELVPGVISSEASFATSSATTTVNLETFARTSKKNDPNYKFDPYDGSALSEIRNSIESEAQQMVENVGFDASILTADDDIEMSESNESEPEKAKILDNYGLDTSETLVDDECFDNDVEGIASLQVGGMSCAVCTGRVEKTILSVSGVKSAAVSLATCRAKVQFLKDTTSIDSEIKNRMSELATQCSDAVNKAGYDCEVLDVYSSSDGNAGGLTLAESAAKLEASRINELKNWSRLLLVSSAFTIPLVFMHYQDMHSSMTENSDGHMKDWMSLCLATPVQFGVGKRFYAAAYHSFMNGRVMGMDFLVCLGTTAAYLYSVIVLAVMIYATPSDFEANGTHLKPMFETGAMLLTFVTLGKYLEAYARGKTASALQTLMELQPTIATRCNIPKECISESGSISDYANINAMQKTEVDIKNVQVGDFLIVIPGARIPTDGVLVHQGDNSRGGVYIDESALSGEPFPVAKKIGDDLYGSTVNQFSVLILRVTATGGKTVLARIVRLIEEAQVNRAPIQALADYIASIFAPGVMFLSALTFIGWAVFNSEADNQERFFVALMSSISVIVVACPCALGLATPTAVMVGTGVGASNGLLIKGGAVLEEAHSVDTVIFDKTGTMTTGRAIVNERMEFLDDTDDYDPVIQNLPNSVNKGCIALWLAACAEMNSAHPLAHAIVAAAKGVFGNDFTCSRDSVSVSNFITVPGGGVESVIEKKDWGRWKVRVGKRSFVFDDKVEIATSERRGDREITYLRRKGQIGVYVSVLPYPLEDSSTHTQPQWRVIGVLGIVDSIEANAQSTVAALRAMGVDVWMCTGDHEITARAVAREVGIDEDNICANVTPEGKADLVTRLQRRRRESSELDTTCSSLLCRRKTKKRGRVAVVGDGINDSIALARADCGIAIGAGTEVAIEAADIVLVRSNLHDVVVALHLSRVVFDRIRLNFIWAIAYNLFALPFAAGVFYPWTTWRVPPAFAGFMMAFSSVSVVTSSLLLRLYTKPIINEDGMIHEQGLAALCSCCEYRYNCIKSIFSHNIRRGPPVGWESVVA